MRTERISFFNRNFFGGILIISLVYLTVALIPYAGSFIIVLIPLPIIFFMESLGRLRGLTALMISLVIVEAILQSLAAGGDISLFLLLGYLGVVIYELMRKALSIEKTILGAVLAGFILAVILLLLQSALVKQTPWALVASYITHSFQESIELLSTQMGAQAEQIKGIKDNLGSITRYMLYMFPALTFVGISFIVWLNIIAVRKMHRINGLNYPDFGDLTQWKAPEETIWFLIVSGSAILIPLVMDIEILGVLITGINILIVCCFIYFLQGLAIFEFYFKHRQVPKLLRIMFYFFLLLQQYLMILLIAVGTFDLWLDFRKINPKPAEPEV